MAQVNSITIGDSTMTTKSRAPEVIKGTHVTVTKYRNGNVSIDWDWDALLHEVRAATLLFESRQEIKAEKAEKKAKAAPSKKNIVKVTEAKVTKTRAKKTATKSTKKA